MVIAGSGNDLLKGSDQIVADIGAVGRAASDVDRDAEGRGRVVQAVLPGASVIGIVGCVRCSHDMVIAAASGDRVASCAIRNGVVSGTAFECVISRAPAHGDRRRSRD